MKFTLIATISILSTIASGLALPDLSRRGIVIRPWTGFLSKIDFPNTFPNKILEVSRKNGDHSVRAFFRFRVPACTGTCTISFSDAIVTAGSRKLQLFTTGGNPISPYIDIWKGDFLVSATGAGPATVVNQFGMTFPCPATTVDQGYAALPYGDDDYVSWDITKGGFIITCG